MGPGQMGPGCQMNSQMGPGGPQNAQMVRAFFIQFKY